MSIGGHHNPVAKTTVWLTPPYLLDALGGAESFDLDPCAADDRPWPTAKHHFTKADNGLLQRWFGRVWLNPPYSAGVIGKWLTRLAEHGNGTALIFARTETEAFTKHVFNAADGLLFIEGRLHFHDTAGVRAKANAGAPSVLCAYGAENVDRLAASNLPGSFVPLTLIGLVQIAQPMGTWAQEIGRYFEGIDRPVTLSELYRAFARHRKSANNPNFKAKIRQVLQRGEFVPLGDGLWAAQTEA